MTLSKSINRFTLLAASIAGLVGSGWLLGPLLTAKIAGPAAIISWPLAGILMMMVAFTFVILARTLPTVGGTVRYFQMSYGHFAGFSVSWIAWLAWVAVTPIETMALIQYSSNYWPSLMTLGQHPVLTKTGMATAIMVMALIYAINHYGIRVFSKVNTFILAFKLVIPTLAVIILLSTHFDVHNFTSSGGFMANGMQSIFAALPMAGVIYSFIGFNPAVQLAAEAKNPKSAVPIAILGSLAICIVLYTFIQVAFIGALSPTLLRHGWQHISFAGDHGPFATLLASFGIAWFVKALYVDAAISPFGTAMVQATATARMTYAMSENGYFPSWLQRANRHQSPHRALLMNMIIGIVFLMPFPSWQAMVGFLESCLVLGYIVGPMSLMFLAKERPELFKGFRPWFIQGVCFVAFYICNMMIFWTGWAVIFKVGMTFIIGYALLAAHIAIQYLRQQPIKDLNIIKGSWVIVYMIGMCIISDMGSFGGHHLIPFGYDFIVIGVFSFGIISFAKVLPNLPHRLTMPHPIGTRPESI